MRNLSLWLWYNNQAEEEAKFFTSVNKDSKIDKISYYGNEGLGLKGSIMILTFRENGMEFMALNGGPEYKFTPAISLVIYCEDQP